MKTEKIIIFVLAGAILVGASFYGGWLIRDKFFVKTYRTSPLRLSGFNFTKPLLMCDTNPERKLPELKPLESALTDYINAQKEAKNIDDASVYFQDLKTDGRIDINPDEKFNPASITKVPIMIAVLKKVEANPDFLSANIKYGGEDNFNDGQEILPKESAKVGGIYTVENLLEKMIQYSDNNSFYLFVNFLGSSKLKTFFADLKVPFPVNSDKPEELNSMTTKDASYFFRVLYNATYLKDNLSEMALELLSRTDFINGIVAGVPKEVEVAHKFGLNTIKDLSGAVTGRELHDCGIVYHSSHPYMLCIMTKTSSSVENAENVIKNISSIVYDQVNGYAK